MLDDGKGNMTSIEMAERCQKLSVLSRQMTIPAEKELLLLQRQVSYISASECTYEIRPLICRSVRRLCASCLLEA